MDAVDHPSPAAPHFFGSGVLSDDGERRVVEYCLLDTFATIALKFRAEWTLGWTATRSRWQPGSEALAGLLMLRLAISRQTVVIASREVDESRLPVGALEEARRVMEGQEFYDGGQIRRHAPGACARMAMVHAEAIESEFTAFLVAARLHEVWTIREEALRAPPEHDRSAEIVAFPLEESRSFDPRRGTAEPHRNPLFARLFDPFGRAGASAPEGRPQ
ncbi:MAG: hypothetical protein Q8S03_05350 [Brevundimonas sp.]|uniref:hypothetical protein n=1 Tax=Brevundimonas sp. TaxID=1871086 RepID=UPI002736224E|nr:hypothetical protein [Brevundimonas sp.]MDP3404095.1 hypothetical protein [Brevundimonas sp.]